MARPLLLVPSERHVEVELAARGSGVALGGMHIRSMTAFVREALARLEPELGASSPEALRLAAARAVRELAAAGRLRASDEPANEVALARALDAGLGRLRRAGTAADMLRRGGGRAAMLLADAKESVDRLLAERRLYDPREALSLLARALGEVAGLGLGPIDRVDIHGVVAFEADDLAALEALHRTVRASGGAGLTVTLPRIAGEEDPFSPVADELERRWASLSDPPEIMWRPVAETNHEATSVLVARNPEGEARAAAREILAALEAGTPPERIAIALPTLDETALEPLRAALHDARVPFSEPRGRPVSASPEGRVALVLLELAKGPITRERVLELLRAPGVHAGQWLDRSSETEAAVRAVALAHRLREVPVEVDRTGALMVEALSIAIANRPADAWMPRALTKLVQSVRRLGEGTTRRDVEWRLRALLESIRLGAPSVHDVAAAIEAEGRGEGSLGLRALGEGAAAARATLAASRALLAGAVSLGCADDPCDIAHFAAELDDAARGLGTGLSTGSARAGAVRIARSCDLPGLSHDLLIALGLDARAFGRGQDVDLLDERLLRALPRVARPMSPIERGTVASAELAWAMAGAARVVLGYATGDEAEPAEPHAFIKAARAHGAAEHVEPPSRVTRQASRIDPRSHELVVLAGGANPPADLAPRVRIERQRSAFFLDPRAPAGAFTGKVECTGDSARARLVALVGGGVAERPLAVTTIEVAAQCPFQGFARRVLRIRRAEDLGESADSRERGTLVHRALKAAFEAIAKTGGAEPDVRRLLEIARSAAEGELGASLWMTPLRREALRLAVSDTLAVVAAAAETDDPLRFFAAERRFGASGEAWRALALEGSDGGPSVFVEGQIDRVDRSLDGRVARVIDYKTGSHLPGLADQGKTAFQLLLYAAVAQRELRSESVEAAFVQVKNRGIVATSPTKVEDRRDLGARAQEAMSTARSIVLRLWDGDVEPRPHKATACAHCDARDVCRRPNVAATDEERA